MKVAKYILIFALAAKAVYAYATHHPSEEELFRINGVVHQVHLGVQGTSTYFLIASDGDVLKYSSYYGIVWPGMERIAKGEAVSILAEKNKLKKGQFIAGREFWIWKLTKGDAVIVKYEDVLDMIKKKEASENVYINYLLYFAFAFLLFAYIQKALSNASEG